jgi:hypothetical protein
MRVKLLLAAGLILLTSLGEIARAENTDPAHMAIKVAPLYNSTGPAISVGPYSAGLASADPTQFLATIAAMKKNWAQLRFAELYVAAIRLYDLGYRKESIYWYYTAQYRGRQFALLVDPAKIGTAGAPAFDLVQIENAFRQLVGSYINGYAFGDLNTLAAILTGVQVEGRATIQDLTALYPGVAFQDKSQWAAVNGALADQMGGFIQMVKTQQASIAQQRINNGVAAKFAQVTSKDLPGP